MMEEEYVRINKVVQDLSNYESYRNLYHSHKNGRLLPSPKELDKIVNLIRSIVFPGYYGKSVINDHTIAYHVGVNIENLTTKLREQILAALYCFYDKNKKINLEEDIREQAHRVTVDFIERLPQLRQVLSTDVQAAYNGDPAAVCFEEIIFCYPAIRAISSYRIAHELLLLKIPLIPRIITEMAHRETGIDIHPGASIGDYFTIDHGTGVVIGETAILGKNVKLYQGVTLGAKSFPLDKKGNPIKGIKRHPIIGDHVVIYSNATILGRVVIGKGASIGGNIWITKDIPKYAKVIQNKNKEMTIITPEEEL